MLPEVQTQISIDSKVRRIDPLELTIDPLENGEPVLLENLIADSATLIRTLGLPKLTAIGNWNVGI